MEKYLIILIVAFIAYYAFKCFKETKVEGFADAQSITGVDEANSINTLAAIAQKLQAGGLTIPGGLAATNLDAKAGTAEGGRVSIFNTKKDGKAGQTNQWAIWNMTEGYGNKLSFWRYNGDGANAGPAMDLMDNGEVVIPGNLNSMGTVPRFGPPSNKFTFHTPDDNRKGLWITPSKDDANSDWLWGYSLNLKRDGNHYLGGNLTAGGNLDIKGKLTFNGGQPAMLIKDYGAGRYVGTDTGVDGNYQAAFGWVTAGCWEQTVTQLYFADGRWRFHAYNARYGDGGCAGVGGLRIYFFHNFLGNW